MVFVHVHVHACTCTVYIHITVTHTSLFVSAIQYGDSYTEDTTVEELREVFKNVEDKVCMY